MNSQPRPIGQLLRFAQTTDPQDIVETLALSVAEFGGKDVVLFVVDYDHQQLRPHPDVLPHGEDPTIVQIDGSMVGRTFSTGEVNAAEREDGWHCWIPVTERAERFGVLRLTMPNWSDETRDVCIEIGIAAAHLISSATRYTDRLALLRRRRDMTLAAEMQWSLLPPLSFSLQGTTVAGLLEPAYEVGGDCFDYSINNGVLDFAVFDAMGHGLGSALLATLAISAYRSARRSQPHMKLPEVVSSIDQVLYDQYDGSAFVTAMLGRLDMTSNVIEWTTAGHHPPIHLRQNSSIAVTRIEPGMPLGLQRTLDNDDLEVGTIAFEPGDSLLLYTDGVTEARDAEGEFFGRSRLIDFVERQSASAAEPSEVLRRVVGDVMEYQAGKLRDDASMLYLHRDQ